MWKWKSIQRPTGTSSELPLRPHVFHIKQMSLFTLCKLLTFLWYLSDRYMPFISWETKTTGNYFTLSGNHLYAFKHQAFVHAGRAYSKQYRRTFRFNTSIYNLKYPTFGNHININRNNYRLHFCINVIYCSCLLP